MGLFRCIFRLLKWAIIFGAVVFGIHCWLVGKSYLFTEESVAALAKKHIGTNDINGAYKQIHQELQKQYPGHVLPEEDLQWVFMNAGGWMGSMCLVHASLTEYILFFGSAVDTVGHSGRYWANISDTLLTGEFRQWKEGQLTVNIYKPGDTVLHAWGEATGVNFKAGTWMLEYGRGFIPSTLQFALADTIFSSGDFVNMFYIFRAYTKALMLEAGHYVMHLQELYQG